MRKTKLIVIMRMTEYDNNGGKLKNSCRYLSSKSKKILNRVDSKVHLTYGGSRYNGLLLVPIHLVGIWLGYDNSDLNLHSCHYIFLATYQRPVDFWCRRRHLFHKFLLENCGWFRFRGDRGKREVVPVPFHQSCTRRGARCMCKNECTERCTGKTSACCNSDPIYCPWLRTLESGLFNENKQLWKMTNSKFGE